MVARPTASPSPRYQGLRRLEVVASFDVSDNKVSNESRSPISRSSHPCSTDGIQVDMAGRCQDNAAKCLGYSGVTVWSPEGNALGRIRLPRRARTSWRPETEPPVRDRQSVALCGYRTRRARRRPRNNRLTVEDILQQRAPCFHSPAASRTPELGIMTFGRLARRRRVLDDAVLEQQEHGERVTLVV